MATSNNSFVTAGQFKSTTQKVLAKIPKKNSELVNDSNFITHEEADNSYVDKATHTSDINGINNSIDEKTDALTAKFDDYALKNHNHDDVYAKTIQVENTVSDINEKIDDVTDKTNAVDAKLANYALKNHTHDMSSYATKEDVTFVSNTVNEKEAAINNKLETEYVTLATLNNEQTGYVKRQDLNSVANSVARISVSLTNYAKKTDIPSSKNFATADQLRETNQAVDDVRTTVGAMYTNDQINSKIDSKASQLTTYTKDEVDAQIAKAELRAGGTVSDETLKGVIAGVGYAKTKDIEAAYATKEEVNTLTGNVYTKQEVDDALTHVQVDTTGLATKESVDTLKTTIDSMYSNETIDGKFATYAPQETTYTKIEVDAAIARAGLNPDGEVSADQIKAIVKEAGYITGKDVENLADKDSVNVVKDTVNGLYTNNEIDAMFANLPAVEITQDYVQQKIDNAVQPYLSTEEAGKIYATKNDLKGVKVDTTDLATKQSVETLTATINGMYTNEQIDQKISNIPASGVDEDAVRGIVNTSLTDYAKTADVDNTYAKKTALETLNSTVSGMYTNEQIDQKISNIPSGGVDEEAVRGIVNASMADYAKSADVETTYVKKGSLTTTLEPYAKKDELTTTLGSYLTKEDAGNTYVSTSDISDMTAKVEKASTDSTTAINTSNGAKSAAETATSTAASANEKAEAATTTANEAKEAVETNTATVNASKEIINTVKAQMETLKMAVSSVYVPAGSVVFEELPEANRENLGKVYNIINEFTTDNRFLEGEGVKTAAGTNVVIVSLGDGYGYDLLSVGASTRAIATPEQVLAAMTEVIETGEE